MPASYEHQIHARGYRAMALSNGAIVAKKLRMAEKFFRHGTLVHQIFEDIFDAFIRYIRHGFE